MRPRLIAVDDAPHAHDQIGPVAASMRPRLIAVDDGNWWDAYPDAPTASMRPRLIAVDDTATQAARTWPTRCFNEATADRRG